MNTQIVKTHIVPEYTDTGFGFPVIIKNVQMANVQGYEVALINYAKLESILIKLVPKKATRLTGAEVKFIRGHFHMTLQEFGKQFGVSHVAVKKWEDANDKPTSMALATEFTMRMWVQRRLSESPLMFMRLWDTVTRSVPFAQTAPPPVLPYGRVSQPLASCLV